MAGHGRSKNGVASLAWREAIHVFRCGRKDVDTRDNLARDGLGGT